MGKSKFRNEGIVAWRSPSNIALVKYWGKYGIQLPRNASVSFTLSNAFTEMQIAYSPKEDQSETISLDFLFEEKEQPKFKEKINRFLESIRSYLPYLDDFHLNIKSRNSFPHSTGIASSASSMSALALCLCQIENEIEGKTEMDESFYQKASRIARLGSGSACRSIYPYLVLWGDLAQVANSSNEIALPVFQEEHPVFKTFQDSILIIDSTVKSVSSRAGHALMDTNPYAEARYKQANSHAVALLEAMRVGDLELWGSIVEKEALTLHALMMASEPPFILMRPQTLTVIEKIREYRQTRKKPVYFTLDAGPNVHMLYPENIKDEITYFIEQELVPLCENGRVIQDQVGEGPIEIK